jgi:hypothetical protein
MLKGNEKIRISENEEPPADANKAKFDFLKIICIEYQYRISDLFACNKTSGFMSASCCWLVGWYSWVDVGCWLLVWMDTFG